MIALLKKDWRQNRVPVIGGIILVATPYLIAAVARLSESRQRQSNWYDLSENCGTTALALTAVVAAIFAGAAFAAERRDRSADFLGMLPVSRGRIVTSKLVVSLGWLFLIWTLNAAVAISGSIIAYHVDLSLHLYLFQPFILLGAAAIMMFGVAWLLSTYLPSPALAASISIGGTIGSMMLIAAVIPDGDTTASYHRAQHLRFQLVCGWGACSGVISLIAGTVYYLRRVEP